MGIYYAVAAFVVLAIIFIKMTVVIIPQSETRIVERLGKYYATLKPGINLIIPFVDRTKTIVAMHNGRYVYTNTIDLREQVYDFARQNVITKDNIQMQYLQPIITQYFIDNKSEIWLLFLIAHSKR